jgi:hypothetical protein
MICAVHAAVGAAVGRAVGNVGGAFVSGVATHLIGDLLPHKDFDPKVEAPLLAVTLGAIVWRCGIKSPEVAGAVGAVAPDIENAAGILNIIPKSAMRFPTHINDGKNHGPKVKSAWPQGVLALLCLVFVFWPRTNKSSTL